MKRRSKKIKWRNPKLDEIPLTEDEIFNLRYDLVDAFIVGNPRYLASAIRIINQGDYCGDCGENSVFCKCEYCEDCQLNSCLCEHNIDWTTQLKQPNLVRQITWKLMKELFDKNELKIIKNDIITKLNQPKYSLQYEDRKFIESLIKI